MSGLRILSLALLGLLTPAVTRAQPPDPLQFFAACTGRLSAEMEFQWLMQDPEAEDTEARRAAMIELVDALMDPGQGREVLGWRVDAKLAHAALLSRGAFNDDPNDAAWARATALRLRTACTELLLS